MTKNNIALIVGQEYKGPHRMRFSFTNAKYAKDWLRICQMYTILLLTRRGSVPSDPTYGTNFVERLWGGYVRSEHDLLTEFTRAHHQVTDYINKNGYYKRNPEYVKFGTAKPVKWAMDDEHAELWIEFYDDRDNRISVSWVPITYVEADTSATIPGYKEYDESYYNRYNKE